MAQHPDSMYTPLHQRHNRKLKISCSSNVAISFLTRTKNKKKKQSDINHGYQRERGALFLLYSWLKGNLEESPTEPSRQNTQKKPKEIEPHLSDPDPAAPGAVPAGWGPVNPAHLMSRLGKGQMIAWFKHLFLLCDLGVVRKRWVLSLAGPVQETIRRSRRPETSPMPVLLSSCALITLCTCSYSLSLPSETSWNTCQERRGVCWGKRHSY